MGSTCGMASRKAREKKGRRDKGVVLSSGGAARQRSPQSWVCAELESTPKRWLGGEPRALQLVEGCLPGFRCAAPTAVGAAGREAAQLTGRVSWGRRGLCK